MSTTASPPQNQENQENFGFKSTMTLDELARQFRRMSLKHHPDRGGSKETFQDLNTTYNLYKRISNPANKQNTKNKPDLPKRPRPSTTSSTSTSSKTSTPPPTKKNKTPQTPKTPKTPKTSATPKPTPAPPKKPTVFYCHAHTVKPPSTYPKSSKTAKSVYENMYTADANLEEAMRQFEETLKFMRAARIQARVRGFIVRRLVTKVRRHICPTKKVLGFTTKHGVGCKIGGAHWSRFHRVSLRISKQTQNHFQRNLAENPKSRGACLYLNLPTSKQEIRIEADTRYLSNLKTISYIYEADHPSLYLTWNMDLLLIRQKHLKRVRKSLEGTPYIYCVVN